MAHKKANPPNWKNAPWRFFAGVGMVAIAIVSTIREPDNFPKTVWGMPAILGYTVLMAIMLAVIVAWRKGKLP